MKTLNKRTDYTFKPSPITSKMIFTDASDTGYSGFKVNRLGKLLCSGKFDENEIGTSSTTRELLAVKICFSKF